MSKIPKFKSIKEEREFWDSHSAFEVLEEDGWQVVEAGTTKVKSIYSAKVWKSGVFRMIGSRESTLKMDSKLRCGLKERG